MVLSKSGLRQHFLREESNIAINLPNTIKVQVSISSRKLDHCSLAASDEQDKSGGTAADTKKWQGYV